MDSGRSLKLIGPSKYLRYWPHSTIYEANARPVIASVRWDVDDAFASPEGSIAVKEHQGIEVVVVILNYPRETAKERHAMLGLGRS